MYRISTKERRNELRRINHIANRERDLEQVRNWYEANKDKHLESGNRWRKNNPEKAKALVNKYRAKKNNATGCYTSEDVLDKYNLQNGRCFWCKKKLSTKYHVDHVIPLSRYGTNGKENIVISCIKCNTSKSNKIPFFEWYPQGWRDLGVYP